MAEYIDVEKLKRNIRVNLMPNVDIDGTVTVENAERYFINLIDKTSTADVAEVEKVAKILVDVTGIAPCEMVSANEWNYDYCNCAELCSQLNYKQCWERYLKHSKG